MLSGEIAELWQRYVLGGLVEREGLDLDDLADVARHYEAFIPSEYREEMRGIASGAGIPYLRILIMNTFVDAVLGASPRACSAFAIRTDRGLLVGRNLDWINHNVAHRTGVVFVLEPATGRRILHVGWPGQVGVLTGMNDHGLTVSLNMAFAPDVDADAMPALLRLRLALERCDTLAEAAAMIASQPRTIAMNVLLTSARDESALVLELSGHREAIVPMRRGTIVATNYYQALPIRGGLGADRAAAISAALVAADGDLEVRDAVAILKRVAVPGPSSGMLTNQSVIFEPRSLTAYVALGKAPATAGRFYRIQMPRTL